MNFLGLSFTLYDIMYNVHHMHMMFRFSYFCMAIFSYAVDFWVKEKKEMKASLSAPKKMALGELCLTIQRKGKNAV